MVKRALNRRVVAACAVLVLSARIAGTDSEVSPPALSFLLEPAVAFPLGPGVGYFLPGVAARVGGEYRLPALPMLSLRGGVIYGFTPIALGLGTTTLIGGVAGASWRVPIVGRLSAHAFADGGYALGMINGNSAASASRRSELRASPALNFSSVIR